MTDLFQVEWTQSRDRLWNAENKQLSFSCMSRYRCGLSNMLPIPLLYRSILDQILEIKKYFHAAFCLHSQANWSFNE